MNKIFIILITSIFLSGCTTAPVVENVPQSSPIPQAPLPTGTDVINLFYQLINDGRIPEAIALMSPTMVIDDSAKQAYGVQFNSYKSVHPLAIEPYNSELWTDKSQLYKIFLEIYVDSSAADLPIPYYGYEDNPNIRFISLTKSQSGSWQIDEIATGP